MNIKMYPVRTDKENIIYMESINDVLKKEENRVGIYVILKREYFKDLKIKGLYPPIEVEFDNFNKIKEIYIK